MFNNLTPVVKNLLIINVVIYFVTTYFMKNLQGVFALYFIDSTRFLPTQFLTYMFMHADGMHLFSNMLGLFIFGPLLEQFLGPKKLFALWMVCGVGAGVLYSGYTAIKMGRLDDKIDLFYTNPNPDDFSGFVRDNRRMFKPEVYDFIDEFSRNPEDPELKQNAKQSLIGLRNYHANIPMVGASGALFGILVAFGMLFPNTQLFLLFPPMPIKAKYLVLGYGLFTLYGIYKNDPTDNVAHIAHLSGLIVGAILVYYWKKSRTDFY
jgi:membrane associated rhomboid family serine protease